MNSRPLVSIAIPAYNHAEFIEACLNSVCAQTYPELELVVIDDGSTDDTFEVARRYIEPYRNRFRRVVLEQRENQGVSANSNACIAACRGDWVHLLGSDDVLYPNKVERIQQFIEDWNCPNLALVHADCGYVDRNGETVTRSKLKSRPRPGPDFEAYRWLFLGEHYVFNPTIALHRATFLASGGFDRNLPLEDLDCWLRLSVKHAIARVPEILASYRKHSGNSSRNRLKMLAAQFRTYAKFLRNNPGLVDERSLRKHFHRNLWRFWRRVRKADPWLFLWVAIGAARSVARTPDARDYERFAVMLDKVLS